MRRLILLTSLICCFSGCSKQGDAPSNPGVPSNGSGGTTTSVMKPPAVSTVSVQINSLPMTVTGISHSRGSGQFNISAWNAVQKVDVRCFWFYEPNRWNYQYSDSITYSTRVDSLSSWTTIRAENYGDVRFDCCAGPMEDSLITGNFSGNFYRGDKQPGLSIAGTFRLIF